MKDMLLAEFREPEALLKAARQAKAAHQRVIDAFSPFPLDGMAELLDTRSTRLRVVMFCGGMAVAAAAYGIEGWSAAFDYPVNSGGRPLNSWPAFLLFPFAVGIFGAALVGLIGLLIQTGLPRLHHPLFAIPGFERATQDRFVLALEKPAGRISKAEAIARLNEVGAVNIWEVET